MIVGFLEETIEGLEFFKESVALYPTFDYVYYADTHSKNKEIPVFMQKGIEWLALKSVDVILLGEGIKREDVQVHTELPLLQKNELFSYLDEVKNRLHLHERGTLRHVHVTEQGKGQDERIASLLGGLFVAE